MYASSETESSRPDKDTGFMYSGQGHLSSRDTPEHHINHGQPTPVLGIDPANTT